MMAYPHAYKKANIVIAYCWAVVKRQTLNLNQVYKVKEELYFWYPYPSLMIDNSNELQAQNPPPSLIPRLHAIAVHNLPHANPLMDARLPTLEVDEQEFNMLAVHKDLRMLLTLCLFSDDLAAEYLLSHLISTVYSRCELQSIGKFSLNICNLPKEAQNNCTRYWNY